MVSAGCSTASKPVNSGNRGAVTHSSVTNPAPIPVDVFEAKPSTAASGDLLIPASLSVEDTAVVLAQRDGTIIQLRVQEGARVAKGAMLAQFGDEDQQSRLRQAELEVSRLKVEEQQYQALIKINQNELNRELQLAKDGLSSQSDVERARYKLEQSTREHEKTQLATQNAQAKLEAVKIDIEKNTVRAPISGIVTRRYVNLGTSVARNDKLFEVAQLSPLQVKFQVPQTEMGQLRPGSIVSLSLANSHQIIARARIRRTDPVADAGSNTLGHLADVVGRTNLIPGLSVNVHIPRSIIGSTIWVPRAAFPPGADLRTGAVSTLLVVEGDKCAERVVEIGTVDGDQVEIHSGLTIGDHVILAPPAGLKAGDTVAVRQT